MKPRTVPIQLGCCPEGVRCALCAPSPAPPDPETIGALIDSYAERYPEEPLMVGFFGGPPPTDALLDAIRGLPFAVRVRPDLLARERADQLIERGCERIELDLLSFDDAVLKAAGRRYRGALAARIAEGLHGRVRIGVVLVPGLPGGSFEQCLADARTAATIADAVRIHPALVIRDSGLADRHRVGTYSPMDLESAVSTCRAMLEILEPAGVEVIRVGLQAGPDGIGHAVAGPIHSSFRELVESRRTLDRLRGMLDGTPSGALIEIRCAPADEARTKGPESRNVRALRAEFRLTDLRVVADPEIERGAVELSVTERESA